MAVKCKADDSLLLKKINAVMGALVPGAKGALQDAAGGVLQKVVAECPVDTGRLINAYSEAAMGAELPASPSGLASWPRPTIKASKYTERFRQRLQEQLTDLQRQAQWIVSKPSSWQTRKGVRTGQMRPSADKWLRRVEKAIDRTREDLRTLGETDILMKSKDGRLRQFSLRQKIYGGQGFLYNRGLVWYATIINREPHANTVEKMHRSFASAMRLMRASGLRRVAAPKMLKRLKAAAA